MSTLQLNNPVYSPSSPHHTNSQGPCYETVDLNVRKGDSYETLNRLHPQNELLGLNPEYSVIRDIRDTPDGGQPVEETYSKINTPQAYEIPTATLRRQE